MNLKPDSGARRRFGVVVSLHELDDGTTRIVIDDVKSVGPQRTASWAFECFYTHKQLDSKALDAMALPSTEYQGLGVAVLARLLALNGRVAP